jgi:uncharacterized protein
MARVYKSPGVYVEEIQTLPPSIAEVETAVPAFIGYTEKALLNGNSLENIPTRITSMLEYAELFGGPQKEEKIEITVNDTYSGEDLVRRAIVPALKDENKSPYRMYNALQMYFANGGGPCYIVSAGGYKDIGTALEKGKLKDGLSALTKYDEPTIIVMPDGSSLPAAADYYDLMNDAMAQCSDLQDRVAIIDVVPDGDNIQTAVSKFRDAISSDVDRLKYGAAYFPYLKTSLRYSYDEDKITINYTKNSNEKVTLTLAQTKDPKDLNPGDENLKGLGMFKKEGEAKPNLELYNRLKNELNKLTVTLPPSSAVAGAYARVDNSRGVWKAPANVSLNYVRELSHQITNNENDMMNIDPSGKTVNAIRFFTGKGILVWGARTLAGNDNEWRYVPVRRFFNFAEESIKKGTHWVVFEPNDSNTWVKVKGMIESFLTKQWRVGALAGAKPEHAFYVKVGLGITMSAQDILEGKINIEIGMAVVRPAEFVILRFSHKLQES